MKKLAMICLVLLLALVPVFSVNAEETVKTVDGNAERWEQESTHTPSLATMIWDQNADTLEFKGTGYQDRIGLKFGFRSNIAFDINETSVTIKFPDEFNALYSDEEGNRNNMHFVIAVVNTWSRWWNTDGNEVKSAGFVVRPIEQDKVSVELAGRWAVGQNGYGKISSVERKEFALDESRTMQFGIKKEADLCAAYINGEKFSDFDVELKDGKTMSDYFSEFHENKAYLQFGATLENDKNATELSYTIAEMKGALDAFKELDPGDPGDENDGSSTPPIRQEGSGDSALDFNWNYVILYGVGGGIGIAALVCYILSVRKR